MAGKKPGSPKTGGRQKGTPNKATKARETAIAESGLTPLEYMLSVMRDLAADEGKRLDAAKAAAPYVHPKLANVELSGKGGGAIKQSLEVSFVGED